MAAMLIATWNINSVKARIETAVAWVREADPDVVCLQEIKCEDQGFPVQAFEDLGYNVLTHGQKTYNGVAILSKSRPEDVTCGLPGSDEDLQARYLEAVIPGAAGAVRVASIYLPNGNPIGTEKFAYKIAWMDRLIAHDVPSAIVNTPQDAIFDPHIRETGMEQFVRDARISMIYEGTNGIQALDLIGRKIMMDQGQKLRKFTRIVHKFCQAQADDAAMAEFIAPLQVLLKDITDLTMAIGMLAMNNRDEVGAAAVDYLRLLGHLVYGYFWARMAKVALEKQASAPAPFYAAKLATARFYYSRLMTETAMLQASIRSGAKNLMEIEEDEFALGY